MNRSATKFEFETELEAVLESKYRMMNITYETMQLAAQELQKWLSDFRVIELVPIADSECEIVEKPKEKRQIQQTMTKFLTANIKK